MGDGIEKPGMIIIMLSQKLVLDGWQIDAGFRYTAPVSWIVMGMSRNDLLVAIPAGDKIDTELPQGSIFTHVEPVEDPTSFEDNQLENE